MPDVDRCIMAGGDDRSTQPIEKLKADFPWPNSPPDVCVDFGPVWFVDDECNGHTRVLKDLIGPRTRVLLELGSFAGRSTRCFLRLCPNAHMIAVDTWLGSPEHKSDPGLDDLLSRLYETFQVNLWPYRDRLTPIRATTIEGMQIIYDHGVVPDVVYVDADHGTESVTADLECIRRLFPDAQIIGDDWFWPSVRTAVEQKSAEWDVELAVSGNVWWLLHKPTALTRSTQLADPTRAKVITITAYRRLEYTRQVVEALSRCAGIDDYLVLFHLEPGYPEITELASSAPLANKRIVLNETRLGCTANTYEALDHGFRIADFVVHIEDDCVPSRDCLRYFEWARHAYRDDPAVFTVTSYSRGIPPPEKYFAVHRDSWFIPWGMGTWSDRWTEMRDRWGFGEEKSWDLCVNDMRGGRVQIQPHLARTQNIGAESGTYCRSPEWHRENQFNEFGAWSLDLDLSTPFREESRE